MTTKSGKWNTTTIISKMFNNERKIYIYRKMIISTRYKENTIYYKVEYNVTKGNRRTYLRH